MSDISSYNAKTWEQYDTITTTALNNMEQGIKELYDYIGPMEDNFIVQFTSIDDITSALDERLADLAALSIAEFQENTQTMFTSIEDITSALDSRLIELEILNMAEFQESTYEMFTSIDDITSALDNRLIDLETLNISEFQENTQTMFTSIDETIQHLTAADISYDSSAAYTSGTIGQILHELINTPNASGVNF